MGDKIRDLYSSFGKGGTESCSIFGSQSKQGVLRFITSARMEIVEKAEVRSGADASLSDWSSGLSAVVQSAGSSG